MKADDKMNSSSQKHISHDMKKTFKTHRHNSNSNQSHSTCAPFPLPLSLCFSNDSIINNNSV